MKKKIVTDLIDWDNVRDKNTIEKKALKKAIKEIGNSNLLAKEMCVSRAFISKLVHAEIIKKTDFIKPSYAKLMEKIVKINGLAKELCFSLRKEKK